MEFPYLVDKDQTRFCYMRVRVLEALLRDEGVLDALIAQLDVPGKVASLRRLSAQEKMRAVDYQIVHFRKTRTSVWRDVDACEILAASIYRAWCDGRLPKRVVQAALCPVKREADLLDHIGAWLAYKGLDAYVEVPLGRKRVDVLGYRKGGLLRSERIVSVELKNDLIQMERGLDQMTTFADFAHETYLACTPALAASYLEKYACARTVKHWDPSAFDRKLDSFGFGLLLVEGDSIYEYRSPRARSVPARLASDARDAIAEARRL